jgi:hypothetical protein
MPYTFGLDQFQIVNPRSGGLFSGTDTDFVSLTLKVGDRLFGTLTKAMGDVQQGYHPVGLVFPNIPIDNPQVPICLNFLITNAGHNGNIIEERLSAAGDDLTGAVLGGTVLGVAIPPEAAIMLALELQTFNALLALLGADCDGLVASGQIEGLRSDFDNQFAAGVHTYTRTVAFPGMPSPSGCGDNSLYKVTMTFMRIDDRPVIAPDPNSTFVIMNRSSGLVLDIPDASASAGIQVQQYPENGGDNQKWRFVPSSRDPNFFKIKSVSSGLLLDVEHSSQDNHARVLQWPDNEGANQHWAFDLFGADAADNEGFLHLPMGEKNLFFTIRNRNSGKVLDVPDARSDANTLIQQYDNHEGYMQHWQLIRA